MAKRELEFSTRLTREDVAGVIEALIEGLKDGRLKVQKSGESLELEVPRVVDLEVEAAIDDERAEFEIEVSWRTNRAENPDIQPEEEVCAPPEPAKKAAAKTGPKTAKTAAPKTAAKSAAVKKASPAKKTTTAKKAVKKPAEKADNDPTGSDS